jgi:hypothetical protein
VTLDGKNLASPTGEMAADMEAKSHLDLMLAGGAQMVFHA